MYKIEKDNSDFMVFLKTELNKLEKDYGQIIQILYLILL